MFYKIFLVFHCSKPLYCKRSKSFEAKGNNSYASKNNNPKREYLKFLHLSTQSVSKE